MSNDEASRSGAHIAQVPAKAKLAPPAPEDNAKPRSLATPSSWDPRLFSRRAVLTGGAVATAFLVDSVMPVTEAEGLQLSANNAPPNTNTYYPEDYGAKGDGASDDTAAIQACVDATVDAGGGTVQFGPKVYLVNGGPNGGGPRHDRGGNAVIALPNGPENATLRLQGVAGKSELFCTLAGQSYSSPYGCPSVLGGPTPEQLGVLGEFSLWTVELKALTVTVTADPTVCGADLSRVADCKVDNTTFTTTNVDVQPTSPYSFGLRLPDGLNYGDVVAARIKAFGFYTGFVCNTAHTQILSGIVKWCVVGIGLTGAGQYDSSDPHASLFEILHTEWCVIRCLMVSWRRN